MVDRALLERKFEGMGSRVKFGPLVRRHRDDGAEISVDVGQDGRGEFFDIRLPPDSMLDLLVMDVQAKSRHLLLMVKGKDLFHKYLCGHDERHWFVAAVPESSGASNVPQAMEALKPDMVKEAQGVSIRSQRIIRQGEWFFIPQPDMEVDEALILTKEPLVRGGGKPHVAEFAYREGGELVYVHRHNPNGLTQEEYNEFMKQDEEARSRGLKTPTHPSTWRRMMRNMDVYVKGRISHSDHATITLNGWHQVAMNTEVESSAMPFVAFLD